MTALLIAAEALTLLLGVGVVLAAWWWDRPEDLGSIVGRKAKRQ